MGPSRGYVVQKMGQENYATTALRPVTKNGANSTGRRQKAENDSFAAYCSYDNGVTQYKTGRRNRDRRHDRFAAHVRKRGDLNQWLVR